MPTKKEAWRRLLEIHNSVRALEEEAVALRKECAVVEPGATLYEDGYSNRITVWADGWGGAYLARREDDLGPSWHVCEVAHFEDSSGRVESALLPEPRTVDR